MPYFVKYINNTTVQYAPLNLVLPEKTILNFRYDETLMRENGFKPLIEVEIDYSRPFHVEYIEHEEYVEEVVIYDPLPDDNNPVDDSNITPSNIETFG